MASNELLVKTKASKLSGAVKLTPKQQAFVRHIVEHPKDSYTEAAMQTYNAVDRRTAAVIAAENLTKPSIVTELSKYNNLVENTLINTVNDYKDSTKIAERTLAVDVSKWVHDKVHGKATQRIEQQTNKVSININLNASEQPTDTDQIEDNTVTS